VIPCLFAADLHGSTHRAAALFAAVLRDRPRAVFLGGDLEARGDDGAFLSDVLIPGFERLRRRAGEPPAVFVVLGNDDPRAAAEPLVLDAAERGLWHYVHGRRAALDRFTVLGYNCIPPSPFHLKDWERYDVSRFTDPGCIPPEEGVWSEGRAPADLRTATIADDLARLAGPDSLAETVCLFHVPPYRTDLDRAALDDRTVDHAPLDVHIGSIAVRRFMERRTPWLGLHGHVHESARLTGRWLDRIGKTVLLSAAHDGPELAVVRFDLERPALATRSLLGADRG